MRLANIINWLVFGILEDFHSSLEVNFFEVESVTNISIIITYDDDHPGTTLFDSIFVRKSS